VKKLHVLIVDDHKLVRAGIKALLQTFHIVGSVKDVSSGREALGLIKSFKPDVILMDIAMPGANGLEVASAIIKKFPSVRIIILSMYKNEEHIVRAFRAGAVGYLSKDAAVVELDHALKTVTNGKLYISPDIPSYVKNQCWARLEQMKHAVLVKPSIERLTSRQREILQLIAEGKNTKEVAYLLKISIKTVESHRMNLMDRLKIHDVPGLVRYAVKSGLVSLDT
jgi:DNA-binding NarL/FixJ family response regulator